MQKVFEKIIEKLEERTSFLSDCTKYGNKDVEQQNKSYSTMMMYEVADLVDDLIDIVKQEAEQYNNGWIPCNELLPAYGQTVLASVCAEDAEWKIIIACYKEEDFWLDGKIDAWQPLPTPYAKGE